MMLYNWTHQNKLPNPDYNTVSLLISIVFLLSSARSKFIISRGAEGPGREILQRPPVRPSVRLSVCLSVTFSFRTVTQKRIDVFS